MADYGNNPYMYHPQNPFAMPGQQGYESEKKRAHIRKTIIYVSVVIGIFIVGIVSYIVFFRSGSEPNVPDNPRMLMDLRVLELPAKVHWGDNVEYNVEALNLGSATIYDIILRYDIINLDGNYFPTFRKEETVALVQKSEFPQSFEAKLAPGLYKVRVTAFYGNEKATASQSFEIVEEDATITDADLVRDDEPATTPPAQTNTPVQTNNDVQVSNIDKITGVSDSQLKSRALDMADSNAENAIRNCLSISNQNNANNCLMKCAEKSGRDSYCESMTDRDFRDDCYMSLALDGNSGLCSKIVNGYKKNSCLALT